MAGPHPARNSNRLCGGPAYSPRDDRVRRRQHLIDRKRWPDDLHIRLFQAWKARKERHLDLGGRDRASESVLDLEVGMAESISCLEAMGVHLARLLNAIAFAYGDQSAPVLEDAHGIVDLVLLLRLGGWMLETDQISARDLHGDHHVGSAQGNPNHG